MRHCLSQWPADEPAPAISSEWALIVVLICFGRKWKLRLISVDCVEILFDNVISQPDPIVGSPPSPILLSATVRHHTLSCTSCTTLALVRSWLRSFGARLGPTARAYLIATINDNYLCSTMPIMTHTILLVANYDHPLGRTHPTHQLNGNSIYSERFEIRGQSATDRRTETDAYGLKLNFASSPSLHCLVFYAFLSLQAHIQYNRHLLRIVRRYARPKPTQITFSFAFNASRVALAAEKVSFLSGLCIWMRTHFQVNVCVRG